MATTLHQLTQFLDQRQWRYEREEAQQRLITGVAAKNVDRFLILIKLTENGEYLQLQAPGLLHVRDHVFKGVLFQTLLTLQYELKLLRLEYDPRDGEIRGAIELPLEDASLTLKQFNRALDGLIDLVDRHAMPRMKAVLATGNDPGQKLAAEQMLEELPPEIVNWMEQIIDLKRERG